MKRILLVVLLTCLPLQARMRLVVSVRPGETREETFSRCGDVGPCTVIFHDRQINGPVYYQQRCVEKHPESKSTWDFKLSPNGVGFPCIVTGTGEGKVR